MNIIRQKFINWLYTWLPRIMGCHCRADRSFHYNNKVFPICARCTGEILGIFIAVVSFIFVKCDIYLLLLMLLPLIIDGTIQKCTKYESTNLIRLITGTLFGYAIFTFFLMSSWEVLKAGIRYGAGLKR